MSIQWTPDMTVKVKLIDEQHQYFMGLLNEFYNILQHDELGKTIRHIIDELAGYAKFHFSTEEKYFDLYDFELKDEHSAMHRAYEKRVDKFKADFEDGSGTKIAFELIDFMENWWVRHISIEDKKYSRCFNEHGLNGV